MAHCTDQTKYKCNKSNRFSNQHRVFL